MGQVQRLTRFEEIHEPLSISFERLSMNVGETRILQNLSGAIYAKNTTALVGTISSR
jgi:ABC-type phosphate transport system ATPase subunit